MLAGGKCFWPYFDISKHYSNFVSAKNEGEKYTLHYVFICMRYTCPRCRAVVHAVFDIFIYFAKAVIPVARGNATAPYGLATGHESVVIRNVDDSFAA